LKIDRDYNAFLNIKKLGMDSLLPQGLRELTPVEIEPLDIAAKKVIVKRDR
jgi:transposase